MTRKPCISSVIWNNITAEYPGSPTTLSHIFQDIMFDIIMAEEQFPNKSKQGQRINKDSECLAAAQTCTGR